MALQHWLQLSLTDGIGPILTRRIIDAAGSVDAACQADARLLGRVDGIGRKATDIARSLREARELVEPELERAEKMSVRVICPDDEKYPVLLKAIPDPPVVLYVKGTIEDRDLHAIAIVGSRRCSFYGREQAERFGALLAGAGMTVVSGGARGVDSAAHRGALAHPQGRTIAVLGCGIDIVYPPENARLFEQIAQKGAVLTEFAIGAQPAPENFPRRNRIVSGLSRAVLVIEADEKSGALITARQACDDHGRPVFALPGRVDNVMSAGPHLLIRDGAVLVRKLEDILDGLDPLPAGAVQPTLFAEVKAEGPPVEPAPTTLSNRQQLLLSQMGSEPAAVDAIIERTGLAAAAVLQELTFLSLKGVVKRVDGQTYVKSRR